MHSLLVLPVRSCRQGIIFSWPSLFSLVNQRLQHLKNTSHFLIFLTYVSFYNCKNRLFWLISWNMMPKNRFLGSFKQPVPPYMPFTKGFETMLHFAPFAALPVAFVVVCFGRWPRIGFVKRLMGLKFNIL